MIMYQVCNFSKIHYKTLKRILMYHKFNTVTKWLKQKTIRKQKQPKRSSESSDVKMFKACCKWDGGREETKNILPKLSNIICRGYSSFPNIFGIPILTFVFTGFMTCISSQTGWQTASQRGTWPPWGQWQPPACHCWPGLRRRSAAGLAGQGSHHLPGCTKVVLHLCCSGPKLGPFLDNCSHHNGLQKCTKNMYKMTQFCVSIWLINDSPERNTRQQWTVLSCNFLTCLWNILHFWICHQGSQPNLGRMLTGRSSHVHPNCSPGFWSLPLLVYFCSSQYQLLLGVFLVFCNLAQFAGQFWQRGFWLSLPLRNSSFFSAL